MKNILFLRVAAIAMLSAGVAGTTALAADAASPVGVWKTVDDQTHQPKSLVRITEENGKYVGHVEKFLRPDADPKRVCKDCTGERKDKPILGMEILWDTKRDGEVYSGKILDPENGKTYSSKLTLTEHGAKMEVRGYVGVSLLGRTQVWTREAS